MKAHILAMYDPQLPLSLHTDASTQVLGMVLYQGMGKEKKVLSAATHWMVMELEALTIVWGIEHNKHYLLEDPSR